MSFFDTVLGTPLGYILYGCYRLVGSYGWAIIVFTLATKAILLPLSVLAQRNAITMVRVKPELEDIKRRFEGNNDLILDEQRALYKRARYSVWKGLLPLLVQVPVILGVIQVVYHPLRHLAHLSAFQIDALIARTAHLLGTSPGALGSAAQMRAIDLVAQRPRDFTHVIDTDVLNRVGGIDLHFLGLNLGAIPSWGDASIVLPFAAGASALALGLYQNRYYVLQRFAGFGSRWGITIFLIAFSFYFALILPDGFGLYWTAANLLSIAVVWVCNLIDNPRKLLDYDALTPPPGPTWAQRADARVAARAARVRERADARAWNAAGPKRFMIYAEGSGYWKYFARLVGWLTEHSDVVVHYVTSDPNDRVFDRAGERLRTYYVGPRALIAFMMRLDVDVCLMTTPDLEKYHIKRSLVNREIDYIYMDHGMTGLNLMLREGALDHFDTIFCYGPNQVTEMRQQEAVYHLPARRLIETGYPLLDDLLESVSALDLTRANEPPVALVAPSWQAQNLLELCPGEVVRPLVAAGFHVIVRPHPEFVKRFGPKLAAIREALADVDATALEFQTDFSSNATVYSSDIVVTDWSTIAQEFSYATKKPSIFVNTPMKVMNPNYEKIAAVPLDITLREEIGVALDVDDLAEIGTVAAGMVAHRAEWHDRIAAVVQANIFHLGTAAAAMGRYVLDSLARHERARDVAAARAAQEMDEDTPEQAALLSDEAAQARLAQIQAVEAQADRLEALAAELRARVAAARALEAAAVPPPPPI